MGAEEKAVKMQAGLGETVTALDRQQLEEEQPSSGAVPSDVTSAIPVCGQSRGRIPGEARGGGGGLCACARSPRGYINMAGVAARRGRAERA